MMGWVKKKKFELEVRKNQLWEVGRRERRCDEDVTAVGNKQ